MSIKFNDTQLVLLSAASRHKPQTNSRGSVTTTVARHGLAGKIG